MKNEEIILNKDEKYPFIPKMLATAFVIPQEGADTYEPMESLKKGTIYPELYMPYENGGMSNE